MRTPARGGARGIRGNAGVEFTLAGIPLVFVLISTVEMGRGMLALNSLGHGAREAARIASRVGENCSEAPNDCASSVAAMAARVRAACIGIPPNDLTVQLESSAGVRLCAPVTSCAADQSLWPPAQANGVGSEITIRTVYMFRPAIAMLWPGASGGGSFGAFRLAASSTERIQF